MTPKDFISTIVDLYISSTDPLYKPINGTLSRGCRRSISSHAEDLFGSYLSQFATTEGQIIIEPQLTIDLSTAPRTIKPDIVLIKNQCIMTMFDLKMDLGYIRSKYKTIHSEHCALAESLKHQRCKSGGTEYTSSDNLKYIMTVVSALNVSNKDQEWLLSDDALSGGIITLTSGVHPNDHRKPRDQRLGKIIVNQKAFDEIANIARAALK